jgi:desampylase
MWVMGLKLSRQQRQQLLDWAEGAARNECCGLLLGQDLTVEKLERAANVADDPERHFEIDPAALITAQKRARAGGPQILGYFHSHPNGLGHPSADDALQAASDGRYWLIIANGAISAWCPVGNPVTFIEAALVEA